MKSALHCTYIVEGNNLQAKSMKLERLNKGELFDLAD